MEREGRGKEGRDRLARRSANWDGGVIGNICLILMISTTTPVFSEASSGIELSHSGSTLFVDSCESMRPQATLALCLCCFVQSHSMHGRIADGRRLFGGWSYVARTDSAVGSVQMAQLGSREWSSSSLIDSAWLATTSSSSSHLLLAICAFDLARLSEDGMHSIFQDRHSLVDLCV